MQNITDFLMIHGFLKKRRQKEKVQATPTKAARLFLSTTPYSFPSPAHSELALFSR